MSNPHRPNTPYRNRPQHHQPQPHYAPESYHTRPTRPDDYIQDHRSGARSPFPQRDHYPDHSPRHNHRRRQAHRPKRDNFGYGGNTSDAQERDHPVFDRDIRSNSWNRRETPSPPHHHPLYCSDTRRTEPPNSIPSSSKPSASNNVYKGGCPFNYALPQVVERSSTNRDQDSRPQRPSQRPERCREASSLHRAPTPPPSGPVKPKYSPRSPIKPISSRSMPSSQAPLTAPNQPRVNRFLLPTSRNLSPIPPTSGNPNNGLVSPSHDTSKHFPPNRRPSRSLSCEKDFNQDERRSLNSTGQPAGTASLRCSAIAHPISLRSESVSNFKSSPPEKLNGLHSQSNGDAVGGHEKEENESLEAHGETADRSDKKRDSVESIFKKKVRMPDIPEADMSAGSTPRYFQSDTHPSAQSKQEMKEVAPSSNNGTSQLKLPSLRSVPAPVRRPGMADTPQNRAAAAALRRAGQADCEEVKLVNSFQANHSIFSYTRAPPSNSLQKTATVDLEKNHKPTGRVLPEPTSTPNTEDKDSDCSTTERDGEYTGNNREKNHVVNLSDSTQDYDPRVENKDANSSKRKGTDLDESQKIASKRPRHSAIAETVDVEDTVRVRRSQRFQPPKISKTWEVTKFEPDRVEKLFQAQLRDQPMLLRISFLGISDADLRSTLDSYKSGKNLPNPDQRHLEVNNNRIRFISNEICKSISALNVDSLNISCNMLTSIGNKLGLCSQLRFLNLSRNRLSCLPQELCDLTNLEVLNLSGNNIAKLPPGLCRLKRLEVLSLARNKLEVFPEDIAAEGAALTGLDIAHNHDFHFFPRCTEHWMKLRVLHMVDTEIYRSLSRKEHRLRPSALLKELAGRKEDMRIGRRTSLRSQNSTRR